MSVFNDPVSAHQEITKIIEDGFNGRSLFVRGIFSDVETLFYDYFLYVKIVTSEDGYQVTVQDDNQQYLFNYPDARLITVEGVFSVIEDCYSKL